MPLQVAPSLVDNCHCVVGVGLPEAEAAKFAVVPVATVTLTGCNLIIGALAAAPTVRFVCAFFIGPEVVARVPAIGSRFSGADWVNAASVATALVEWKRSRFVVASGPVTFAPLVNGTRYTA